MYVYELLKCLWLAYIHQKYIGEQRNEDAFFLALLLTKTYLCYHDDGQIDVLTGRECWRIIAPAA